MIKKDTFCREFPQSANDFPGSFSEVVVRRFSVKEVFLEFSQIHSFFLIKLGSSSQQFYLKKRVRHRHFPVNFAKFTAAPLGDCLVFDYFKRGFSLCISFCRFFIKTLLKKIYSWTFLSYQQQKKKKE